MPNEQWERDILNTFSELRLYMFKIRQSPALKAREVVVPALKDSSGWQIFCVGKAFQALYSSKFESDSACSKSSNNTKTNNGITAVDATEEESDMKRRKLELVKLLDDDFMTTDDNDEGDGGHIDTEPVDPEPQPYQGTECNPPTLKLLCQFDQVLIQRLLTHHVNWLTDLRYTTATIILYS